MTRERGPSVESKNCKILLFPTADRRFGQIPHCTELKASEMPGDCPGGMGGFEIDWYIMSIFKYVNILKLFLQYKQ